eukprot:TRINITY_DN13143_c0_g1_i6.p1 TRINITY_DN13143_c0_g1~~TRINITY_DN13143_c0_g1_i6.p1  ORF type:complete len:109 (-),score=12.18 TRINITY_DN13143_c0_g1_i6:294-620(-)
MCIRDRDIYGGPSGSDGKSSDLFRLGAIRDVEHDKLMTLSGVKGVTVGRKEVAGEETCEMCLVVFVRKKVPLNQLSSDERIPARLDPYNTGDAFSTDVIEWADSDEDQ